MSKINEFDNVLEHDSIRNWLVVKHGVRVSNIVPVTLSKVEALFLELSLKLLDT